MKLILVILAAMLDFVPAGKAYMKPLQQRDSILIADQLEYGFQLDSVSEGTAILLPDYSKVSNDTLTLVKNWELDTLNLKDRKKKGAPTLNSIRAHIVLAPFEEGKYELPAIPVCRVAASGQRDTLLFEGMEVEVKTMPVDTATFEIKDIRGQIRYPLTFKEILPWLASSLAALALIAALVRFIVVRRRRRAEAEKPKEPAYIVALRELDKFRGDKFWAPEKQKQFYSGVTDTLKFYIDERFGVDAPEMTTAELFAALKGEKALTPELYGSLRDMFETADYVKFAKFTASDEENAKVLPLAVRFVTTTYQTELEEEQKKDEL